ncbi:MAG: Gfo/Idh/MocA family oxidoreductase [Sedimentisphaerales bacterium]|nr:Gfo/Idh/MocA family oxidoreductase [Sedimentisphaerales bacterium]
MKDQTAKQSSSRSGDLNRREFLAGAAAGAAFTVIQPERLRGTEANSKIEVGCVGLGGRGRLIAGMLKDHPDYQITAVADYFPQVAASAGETCGVAEDRRFSGLLGCKRLIESKVDAVFLETPPCFFPQHAAAAVEAGCHVYMAKPVAVDVPGCRSIAQSAKKATAKSRVFLVDFQVPTHPFNIETVKRCKEGLIGKIGLLSSIYCDEAFADPPKTETIESRLQGLIWVNDIAIGGGMLVNAGIHAIDAALWLAGDRPISAMGSSATAKPEPHGDTKDVYSITYRFADGLILNHRGEHLRNTHGFACSCTAYGQDGYAEINYEGNAGIRGNKGGYKGGTIAGLYEQGIRTNLDILRDNITEGRFDNPTAAGAVNSTLTTILGRQAAAKNALVMWDDLIAANEKIEVDLTGLKE